MVYDENNDQIEDLEALPLVDGDKIVPIFSADGKPILRHNTEYHRDAYGGLLVDLGRASAYWKTSGRGKANGLRVYPQSFLPYGHIQADGGAPPLKPVYKEINRSITRGASEEESEDSDSDLDHEDEEGPLEANYFQAYNVMQHRSSASGGTHPVQHGEAAALLLGKHYRVSGSAAAFTEDKLESYRTGGLPHNRWSLNMVNQNVPANIRLETVFTLHLNKVPREDRHGQYVSGSCLAGE